MSLPTTSHMYGYPDSDSGSSTRDHSTSHMRTFPDTAPLIEFLQRTALLGHLRVHANHLAWNHERNEYTWWLAPETNRSDLGHVMLPFGVVIAGMTPGEFASREESVIENRQLRCVVLAGRDQAWYQHLLEVKMIDCMVVDSTRFSTAQLKLIATLFNLVEELDIDREWAAAIDEKDQRLELSDPERWLTWATARKQIDSLAQTTDSLPSLPTLAKEILAQVVAFHPSITPHWYGEYNQFITEILQYPYHRGVFDFTWMEPLALHIKIKSLLEFRMSRMLSLHALLVVPDALDWYSFQCLSVHIPVDRAKSTRMRHTFYPGGRRSKYILSQLSDTQFDLAFTNLTTTMTAKPFRDVSIVLTDWVNKFGHRISCLLIHLTAWVSAEAANHLSEHQVCIRAQWLRLGLEMFAIADKDAASHWESNVDCTLHQLADIVEDQGRAPAEADLGLEHMHTPDYLVRFNHDVWFHIFGVFTHLFGAPRAGPLKMMGTTQLRAKVHQLGYIKANS